MAITPDYEQSRTVARRAVLLVGLKGALLSAVVGRMYFLQVSERQRYQVLAEENRINTRLLVPPRGRVLDRNGIPLALNREDYRVILVAERTRDLEGALDKLNQIIALTAEERAAVLREVHRQRRFVPVMVQKNLTWDQVARIEVNAPDLPGILITEGLSRTYPHAHHFAHTVGYVGPVSEAEQATDNDPLLRLPEFRIGKYGVEREYDALLRGQSGVSRVEINASGRVQRELMRAEGSSGADVIMTLDAELQTFIGDRLAKETSATAVVLDVHNGDVLAMASSPGFDPNLFVTGITSRHWRDLQTDRRSPMINKAVSGAYPPGSTYKMVVALAGLEAGVITPRSRVFCPGHYNLGTARFHCWRRGGHGSVDMREAIKVSCDVYFYKLARDLGLDRIVAMSHRLGLGEMTGIDLPRERPGLIPTRAWKRKQFRDRWHPGETVITGIGQGYVLSTPLQLAVMTARIANGRWAVKPRIVRAAMGDLDGSFKAPPAFEPLGIDPGHLALVRDAMFAATNEPGGTAYWTRVTDPDMVMAGKTGTSQVRRITREERARGIRKTEELPWELRHHALYVAHAPADKPRYAISVLVEHGGGGSAVAAPIAKEIADKLAAMERSGPNRMPGLWPARGEGGR